MDESGSESTGLKLSMSSEKEERNDQNQSENSSSVKWMSSKMRLMKKMMYSSPDAAAMQKLEDHQKQPPPSSLEPDNGNNNNNTNTIRVCADCNTTKTPLWRSGPRGPKVTKLILKRHFLSSSFFVKHCKITHVSFFFFFCVYN